MDNKVVVVLTNLEGQAFEVIADVTKELVVKYADGTEKSIKLAQGAARETKDINEMTIEELRVEIRNAGSVYFKNKKKYEALVDDAAKAEFNTVKLEEQKARVDAANALFDQKFAGQAKAVGSTKAAKPAKETKIDKLQGIIDSIQGSNLPDDQKNEALNKLVALLDSLKKPAKKPAADAEATVTAEGQDTPSDVDPMVRGRR
jgi:hypothetical protein